MLDAVENIDQAALRSPVALDFGSKIQRTRDDIADETMVRVALHAEVLQSESGGPREAPVGVHYKPATGRAASWYARIELTNGKMRVRSFSIAKWGEEARRLAEAAREEILLEEAAAIAGTSRSFSKKEGRSLCASRTEDTPGVVERGGVIPKRFERSTT